MKNLTIWLRILSLVVIPLTTGCGRGTVNGAVDHGVFEAYFQSFEAASVRQGRATFGDSGVSIQFGDTSGACSEASAIGCAFSSLTSFGIVVNETYWNTISETKRTELIWHELGHALLGRVHTTAQMRVTGLYGSEYVNASIMAPNLAYDDAPFETYHELYEVELFANAGH